MQLLRFYLPLAVYALVLMLGVMRWKQSDGSQRLVPAHEGLCLGTTLGLALLNAHQSIAMILVHAYSPIRTMLFAEMFARATHTPKLRWWLRGAAFAFLSFWLGWWGIRGIESFTTFSNPVFHANSAVNLLLALVCLADLSRDFRAPLTAQPAFWIATGLLLDSALSLLFFPARSWLIANRRDLLALFNAFHALWVIASHILFAKALLCPPRTPSS